MPLLRRPAVLVAAIVACVAGALVAASAALFAAAPAAATAAAPAARSAAVARTAHGKATRHARASTRLRVTAVRGRALTVTGVLSRRTGVRVVGRRIAVHLRDGDTGAWHRAALLRTNARGVVTYRIADRPSLQVTLRFAGDGRYRPAASVLLVPHPTATGLAPGLVRALARARSAARSAGYRLVVNSGYRAWSRQEQMYEAAVRRYGSARLARRWVLPPSESTHVRGLAVDLGTPAAAAWLARRSARFDLCRAYGDEPWHFEYRPDWVAAYGGRCPAPVPLPGDPGPLSPRPRVAVR